MLPLCTTVDYGEHRTNFLAKQTLTNKIKSNYAKSLLQNNLITVVEQTFIVEGPGHENRGYDQAK